MSWPVWRWRIGLTHDPGHTFRRNRRSTGPTGFVRQQTANAFRHETLLPAPDRRYRFVRFCHEAKNVGLFRGRQEFSPSPVILLDRHRGPDNRFRAPTLVGRHGNENLLCESLGLARKRRQRILHLDSFFRLIH